MAPHTQADSWARWTTPYFSWKFSQSFKHISLQEWFQIKMCACWADEVSSVWWTWHTMVCSAPSLCVEAWGRWDVFILVPVGYRWIDHSGLDPVLHRASTGRQKRLEALIWERQAAAVTGSWMSGGEKEVGKDVTSEIHTSAHKHTRMHTPWSFFLTNWQSKWERQPTTLSAMWFFTFYSFYLQIVFLYFHTSHFLQILS